MKRSPLRRKTPLQAAPRPDFAVIRYDVLCFLLGQCWRTGTVLRRQKGRLLMETPDRQRAVVPLRADRLRRPEADEVGAYQALCKQIEQARTSGAVIPGLPVLSGPVVVYGFGAPVAVPKPQKPWRSKKYRKFVRQHPCCNPFCRSGAPVEAHHTGRRGVGQKAGDETCVPLCWVCHQHPRCGVTDSYTVPGLTREETKGLFIRMQTKLQTEWAQRGEAAGCRRLAPLLAAVAALLVLLAPVLAEVAHA